MDKTSFDIQKQIEQFDKAERELVKQIENEEEQEKLLRDTCLSIANSLMNTPKVKAVIDGREFLIAMTIREIPVKKMHVVSKEVIEVKEPHITLVMADINLHKITGGKYIPYTATGKIDKQYSVRDNIVAVTEGLVRHITGLIKPEILE